jgi:phosphomannomutase
MRVPAHVRALPRAQVLQPLGADITGSQFLEPDGTFPNHIPNPENKAAMAAAVGAVKESGGRSGCCAACHAVSADAAVRTVAAADVAAPHCDEHASVPAHAARLPCTHTHTHTPGADLGIVFDTDVDRSAVVDGDGTPINSNRFIALMAAIVLQVRVRVCVRVCMCVCSCACMYVCA